MPQANYQTKYGSSSSRSEHFSIYDSLGDYVASAYTVDSGKNWFIRGLFRDTARSFTSSQVAIEQAIFLYEKAHEEHLAAIF